ncbi:MAG: DUF1648 domain-containing protein [Asticcacaulis sp.]
MKTEKILSFGLWLAIVAIAVWGHFHLPDGPMATHYGLNGEVNGTAPARCRPRHDGRDGIRHHAPPPVGPAAADAQKRLD